MTQFQQALIAASEGKLHTPTVSNSEGNIDYFSYQLAVHKYNQAHPEPNRSFAA